MEQILASLLKEFQAVFNTTDSPRYFFAPGRINLIGEHTDYNGGHVFPASISFGTYALAAKRNDKKLKFYSVNFPEKGVIVCDLDNLNYNDEDNWANYPKGMIRAFLKDGFSITNGADILYYGNIPNGAGLSSSASIEIASGVILENLYNLTIDRVRMVQLGQKVENEYIGVNSGIMDQFAIGKGKQGHAILLNCQSLAYSYAPLKLENQVITIINSNKRRELAGSKYNERRSECERALHDLQSALSITSLGELSIPQFEANKHLIKNSTDQIRAKHAVYENQRTLLALEKLKENKLEDFGKLMNESHLSLQHDYEVTGIELDTIVETAWQQEGVLGARMTGAGFGGCAIAIVAKDHVESFKQNVQAVYLNKIGYEPTFYVATIGDGAKEIEKEGVFK